MAGSVLDDPRWHAFNKDGFACSCGQTHVGLFSIDMHAPAGWLKGAEYEPDEDLRMIGNFLSADLCVGVGKTFMIRVRLPLQMRGAAPWAFMYTVWASVDRTSFEGYVAARREGRMYDTGQAPARLVSKIGGYEDTMNLLGAAIQPGDGMVPILIIKGPQPDSDPDHRLIRDQRDGIDVDRMLELFAAYGHDMHASAGGPTT